VGAVVAWPLVTRAQQAAMPVIGFLNSRTAADTAHLVRGFRRGLAESDYIEGQNVAIEYRWAGGQYDRLPELALELVRRPVAVIVATGGDPVGLAAKAATSTIPIVFVVSGDPAMLGLAASFSRPGGNSTGLSIFTSDIGAKRLGLLFGFLSNPAFPTAETQLNDVQEGARSLGVEIEIFRASTETEIESAFNAISQQRPAALVVAADPFYDTRRVQLVILTARHSLPAMYHLREYAAAGGLMSYGIDLADVYRQMGSYAGKILRADPQSC
jgi:putative ABC transport system substrate-binding protein